MISMIKHKALKRNVQQIDFSFKGMKDKRYIFCISDLHLDNAHCDREKLVSDLEKALELDAAICIFGDTLDAMQSKTDPRQDKAALRWEAGHGTSNYFDSIVEEAAVFLAPYSRNIVTITPGNHETAILKRHETDLVDRLCCRLRQLDKNCTVAAGGYANWIRIQCNNYTTKTNNILYAHHGYGGGGGWNSQINAFQKLLEHAEADIYVSGHIHKKYFFPIERAAVNRRGLVKNKTIHMIRCASYKPEYEDGFSGWAVEKGIGPRPLGGWLIEFSMHKKYGIRRRVYEI